MKLERDVPQTDGCSDIPQSASGNYLKIKNFAVTVSVIMSMSKFHKMSEKVGASVLGF